MQRFWKYNAKILLVYSSFILILSACNRKQIYGVIFYDDKQYLLNSPVISTQSGDTVTDVYRFNEIPGLLCTLKTFKNDSLYKVTFALSSKSKLKHHLKILLYHPDFTESNEYIIPDKNGTVRSVNLYDDAAWYRCAGVSQKTKNDLAIPLVISTTKNSKNVLLMADPYFSTCFSQKGISWEYPVEIGLEDSTENREIYWVNNCPSSMDTALKYYYNLALHNSKPAPEWTRDIAMVDYDYLSNAGSGWFSDIDSLCAYISQEDRKKVCLALHGWYDYVGRYCFDEKTGKLDTVWKSFVKGKGNMSIKEIHHRIQYAKSKGFKVVLYYADGVLYGSENENFSPERTIPGGGWTGPDIKGKTCRQNPCHPGFEVFYKNYLAALLKEYGNEVDGFVWDETFYVMAGHQGNQYFKGYADRKMMRLIKEFTEMVHKVKPECCFFTSDVIGNGKYGDIYFENIPPYALFSDGTFMDSNCKPEYWSYNIFPNYRNTVWSCNWFPITHFDYAKFGVEKYQAAVPVSNGSYGDDKGFSELSPYMKKKYIDLFNERKKHPTKLSYFSSLPVYSGSNR